MISFKNYILPWNSWCRVKEKETFLCYVQFNWIKLKFQKSILCVCFFVRWIRKDASRKQAKQVAELSRLCTQSVFGKQNTKEEKSKRVKEEKNRISARLIFVHFLDGNSILKLGDNIKGYILCTLLYNFQWYALNQKK